MMSASSSITFAAEWTVPQSLDTMCWRFQLTVHSILGGRIHSGNCFYTTDSGLDATEIGRRKEYAILKLADEKKTEIRTSAYQHWEMAWYPMAYM